MEKNPRGESRGSGEGAGREGVMPEVRVKQGREMGAESETERKRWSWPWRREEEEGENKREMGLGEMREPSGWEVMAKYL